MKELSAKLIVFLIFSGCASSKLYQRYGQLDSGQLYLNKCTSCHGIRTVENYSFDKWKAIVDEHSQIESDVQKRRRRNPLQLSQPEYNAIIAIHSQVQKLILEEKKRCRETDQSTIQSRLKS